MTDEEREAGTAAGTDAEPARPVRRGLDVAREALAAARTDARKRGVVRRRTTVARGETDGRLRRQRAAGFSGPAPDERDPQLVGRVVGRLVSERGWSTEVAIGGVVGRWREIVGPDVAAHCRPTAYDDAVLTVVTDSTAWATQVRLLAPQLVRRLNEVLGHGTVRRVVVRGPQAPSWRKGAIVVRGRGPRDTYG